MADHRKPELSLHVRYESGKQRTAALFPANLFPGGESARDRYRVRLGRSWHMPGGQKYAFLTLDEAWGLLLGQKAKPQATSRPDIPLGSYVRVPSSWVDGEPVLYTRTYTRSAPFQGVDGRWRVLCMLFPDPVLVDDIKTMEGKRR